MNKVVDKKIPTSIYDQHFWSLISSTHDEKLTRMCDTVANTHIHLQIDGTNHYRFVAIESFKRCNQNDDGEGFILYNQQLLLSHAHPIKSRTTEVKMSTGAEGTESEKENNSKDCRYLTFEEMVTCWRKAQRAMGAHLKMKQHDVYSIAMMGQSIKGKYT